ncbi:PACE efflux transporter [Aquincola tertiaricarbonis]|uniref:PACE efflux transporter n=1 Tax=Aquincola tertiaricarbonis TaxID=391953 RepID=A0ABY4SCR4_AQUTE|nr:PACE efflux transporter [Aquincola tertiaricarbonis]URI09702.1 PACE efflux transporter [Aquincola tertiaricarbonis]
MQGIKRRIVFITLYEAIAITIVAVTLALVFGQGLGHSGALAVMSSIIAVLWNLTFTHFFERWEARQAVRGRSLKRRIAHAVGFEGGLVALLVPTFAWWLDISLWEALVADLGFVLFFLVYTFVFNWGFDRVFGLPSSAAPGGQACTQA